MKKDFLPFCVLLFVVFVDYLGIGLVFPLFSAMLFDPAFPILAETASDATRGMTLGVLLSLMPFAQFFSAPIWGILSDCQGRKKPLAISMIVTFVGYSMGLIAVYYHHLWILIASRLIVGLGSGNTSIVQAAVADLSGSENKTARFGLFSAACGVGFTVGPLLGGILGASHYNLPFLLALALVFLNVISVLFLLQETLYTKSQKAIEWVQGLVLFKKALKMKELRGIFAAFFLHTFAWSYFFECAPIYLMGPLHFSVKLVGLFYGIAGAVYSVGTGLMLRPFAKRFTPLTLFFWGNALTGLSLLSIFFFPSFAWFWVAATLMCLFVAFCFPSAQTIVSNQTDVHIQGEALGMLAAINAGATAIAPLCAGSLVGKIPLLAIFVSAGGLFLASFVLFLLFGKNVFRRNSTS